MCTIQVTMKVQRNTTGKKAKKKKENINSREIKRKQRMERDVNGERRK